MNPEELILNPFTQDEDKLDPQIPTATLQIYKYIGEHLERKKDTHINRASSASVCYKRRWFQKNGYVGTPLTPRKSVNFLLGDLAERTIIYFIKNGLVGDGQIYSEVRFGKEIGSVKIQGRDIAIHEQEELVADIGGIQFTCHIDGIGRRNSDGQFEIIEIKSASNYGFDDFKINGPGNYLNQGHVAMRTSKAIELGVNSIRYYYLLKNTGHIFDRLFYYDQAIMDKVIHEARLANQSKEPDKPDYGFTNEMTGQGRGKKKIESGRKLVNFPCTYCSFTAHCYPGLKVEWSAGRNRFLVPKYVIENEKNKIRQE